MKRSLLTALVLCSLTLCTLVPRLAPTARAQAATDAPAEDSAKYPRAEFVAGNVLVRFRPGAALAAATKRAAVTLRSNAGRPIAAEVEEAEGLSGVVEGLRLARVAPEQTAEAVAAFARRPDVLYAEPDYVRRKDAAPNDPRYPQLWGLKNTGQPSGAAGADIRAEQAWDVTTGSRQVVVGVVDEGVDITHPDLQANVWTNPGEVAGNGLDDDGNGYVDDLHGWDFFHEDATVYDNSLNASGAEAPDAHGTHVAGTIGAAGNNGEGVVGVNWQVSLMSLKVLGFALESPAPSSVSTTVRAYAYAKAMRELWVSSGGTRGANVRVLNNSYGGFGRSQAEQDAIRALASAQILFVASAGNEGKNNDRFPNFPSGYDEPNVISVAATDRFDLITSFSNFGPNSVHMAAPGAAILSTTPNNTYSVFDGTSMAAPHVSGAAALACAANPNISLAKLRAALLYSGKELGSLSPTIFPPGVSTGRRLDAAAALAAAAEADATAPAAPGNFRITSQNGRAITLSWTAPGDDGFAGRAGAYELRYSDTELGADAQFAQARRLVAPLTAAGGTAQTYTVKIPFRHPNGFVGIRAVDNTGNVGPIASVAVSVELAKADPYTVTAGAAEPLSTGGTPLGLVGDDKLKADYVLPFLFPFFEGSGNGVTVSTNGTIYFTNPPPRRANGDAADAGGSREGLLRYAMIAGLWEDLRTDRRPGDDVYVVTPDSNRIIFRWQAVTFDTRLAPGLTRGEHPVSFEIELRRDGTIKIRYGAGNESLFPVVGISAGEADQYVADSHTSESAFKSLADAPTLTFALRSPPRLLANLVVGMKGTPNPVATGQQISYTIDYVNHGPEFDRDVVITDELPAGTTFVSCAGAGTCTAPPVGSGGRVSMRPGNAGTSLAMTFTVVVRVTAAAGTKIVNTVTAAGGITEDPDTSNNTAAVSTDVVAEGVFAGVKAVGAGDGHTLAVRTDGKVWGWGANNAGEAALSPDSTLPTPTQVANVSDITAVSGGGSHSLALKSDGTVWAWGMNSAGQLGRSGGFSTQPQPPGQVPVLGGAVAVSAGYMFSVALRNDGTVWTWGDNTYGQLGAAGVNFRSTPTQVAGLTNVTAVATGYEEHVLAVRSDGTVWAWGGNRFGELGDGTTTSRPTPAQVTGLTNVKAVAAGHHFSVALKQDGTVWTWGGSPVNPAAPTQLAGLSGVAAVDAGSGHAVALKTDGTVWTWGSNFDGQLGDGTTSSDGTPRQVAGLSGVLAVAAGAGHTVALLPDGTVRAWGSNQFRQLGDGTDLRRTTPVQVSGVLFAGTPFIEPGGGFFTGPVSVRLTSGTEGAAIHYTTNGQDPTQNDPSVASGASVTLTRPCTLKAKAFREGFVPSNVSFSFFTVANPIDNSEFFVAQHYRDFLGREADAEGLKFWTDGINACGFDPQCVEVKRIHTSAAFFLSIEFQETGYLAYRARKSAFGNLPGKPVPLTLDEMLADVGQIGAGVIVGKDDWRTRLAQNKRAYFDAFVAGPRFAALYPATMAPAEFVDALNRNAGGALSQAERDALVADLTNNAKTRAEVLRAVAEDADLNRAESNRAFVLMEYFGYLRRNPDAAPDADFTGFNFWLSKLEEFDGDFVRAEMVKAFLSSDEYRRRFFQ